MAEHPQKPDETAIYDSTRPAAPAPAATPEQPPRSAADPVATAVHRTPSMQVTIGLLAALLVPSLVVLVSGLALVAQRGAAQAVSVIAIVIGSGLLLWYLRCLVTGSGRRSAYVNHLPWVGLVAVAGFGVTTGFSLFDLLTNVRDATRIALLSAGVVGIVAALVCFVRDSDLHERGLDGPPAAPSVQLEAVEPDPEPVYFDPTDQSGGLRPLGVAATPRRGKGDTDAALWAEPAFEDEEPEPPRRARRAAED